MEAPENERYARQVLVFGAEGQSRLASAKVGIVGLGGLGSQVAQALAFLGVRKYVLVDDDFVATTNLNRLIGATLNDAKTQLPKVATAERLIILITPNSHITAIQASVRSLAAFEALRDCSVIFGCVDHDGARYLVTEYAAAYSIPLIDCASDLSADKETFGGRVIFALPGRFCTVCAGQVDLDIAKQELESLPEREFRQAHGYGLGESLPSPSVVSLNGVVANLAVTEFLKYVTETYPPQQHLVYKADRGIVTSRQDEQNPNCYVCHMIAGSKDKANLERYLRTGLPSDLPV